MLPSGRRRNLDTGLLLDGLVILGGGKSLGDRMCEAKRRASSTMIVAAFSANNVTLSFSSERHVKIAQIFLVNNLQS